MLEKTSPRLLDLDLAVIKVKIVPSMLVEITVLVAGTEPGWEETVGKVAKYVEEPQVRGIKNYYYIINT